MRLLKLIERTIDEIAPTGSAGTDGSIAHWYLPHQDEYEFAWDVAGYNLYSREPVKNIGPQEWAILDDDTPIGFIRTQKSKDYISISMIRILEEYRGQGIAMEFYKSWLEDGVNLLSDTEQTSDGNQMWMYLAADHPTFGVHATTLEIIEEINSESRLLDYMDDDGNTRLLITPGPRTVPLKDILDEVSESEVHEIKHTGKYPEAEEATGRNILQGYAVDAFEVYDEMGQYTLMGDISDGVILITKDGEGIGIIHLMENDHDTIGHYIEVNTVFLLPKYRKKGIGQEVYSTFLKNGLAIVSDSYQSSGAIALWRNLVQSWEAAVETDEVITPLTSMRQFKDVYKSDSLLVLLPKPRSQSLSEITMEPFSANEHGIKRAYDWSKKYMKPIGVIGDYEIVGGHRGTMYAIYVVLDDQPVGRFLFTPSGKTFRDPMIELMDKARGKGLGINLYELLAAKGITIYSDLTQSEDSKKMWSKLAQRGNVEAFAPNEGWTPAKDEDTLQKAYTSPRGLLRLNPS